MLQKLHAVQTPGSCFYSFHWRANYFTAYTILAHYVPPVKSHNSSKPLRRLSNYHCLQTTKEEVLELCTRYNEAAAAAGGVGGRAERPGIRNIIPANTSPQMMFWLQLVPPTMSERDLFVGLFVVPISPPPLSPPPR